MQKTKIKNCDFDGCSRKATTITEIKNLCDEHCKQVLAVIESLQEDKWFEVKKIEESSGLSHLDFENVYRWLKRNNLIRER